MKLFLQLLTAAVLIAGMILLRVYAMRQKPNCNSAGGGCGETECNHACSAAKSPPEAAPDQGN